MNEEKKENSKKAHDINMEIHMEVVDDGKEDPNKVTIDNGFLPWGSIFLICVIVDTILLFAFLNIKESEFIGNALVVSVLITLVMFFPFSRRIDKKMDYDNSYPSTIDDYM